MPAWCEPWCAPWCRISWDRTRTGSDRPPSCGPRTRGTSAGSSDIPEQAGGEFEKNLHRFWYGSVIRICGWSGSCLFFSGWQDANKKYVFYLKNFLLITFWSYIYIIFQRQKDRKSHKTVGIKFFYYFCLMIEGSGSLFRINGSGSGRPKSIRIIRNTACM
jgi:hypothetical protein